MIVGAHMSKSKGFAYAAEQTHKELGLLGRADKAWEKSKTRIVLIVIITYIIAYFFLLTINVEKALLSALVPTISLFLSIQSFPFIKKCWIKKVYKR